MSEKASWLIAATVGSTMIARTITAGAMPGPESEVENSGNQPKVSCRKSATGRSAGITT